MFDRILLLTERFFSSVNAFMGKNISSLDECLVAESEKDTGLKQGRKTKSKK